jgi:hypothetical protein
VTSTPEDGHGMFLRNVGIDLKMNTTPKPKTSTTTDTECCNNPHAVSINVFFVTQAITIFPAQKLSRLSSWRHTVEINCIKIGEISGSQGGEYEDDSPPTGILRRVVS